MGSLVSIEGHANSKLACIEHTQNGDVRTCPSIGPQTTTSSTSAQQASPGDTSNWVFNLEHKRKIFCNTYAICLTSRLVKYTPLDNHAEWNELANWKFQLSVVSRFLEPSLLPNIFSYEKLCLKYKKNSNKIPQVQKPWIWNSRLFKEVQKRESFLMNSHFGPS